jgi:surface protein
MFSFSTSFNQDVGKWNVRKVTNMEGMFKMAGQFNQFKLYNWQLDNLTNTSFMFDGARSFRGDGLSSWYMSKVTNMSYMFRGTYLTGLQPGEWDVSQVTDLSYMFSGSSLVNVYLNQWDVSKVTNMSNMFAGAQSFNYPIDQWDVSNVTNMSNMFLGATRFNQAIDSWDVSKVTSMSRMFENATSFNQSIESWDASSLTSYNRMFLGASSFKQDLSSMVNESSQVSTDYYIPKALRSLDSLYLFGVQESFSILDFLIANYDSTSAKEYGLTSEQDVIEIKTFNTLIGDQPGSYHVTGINPNNPKFTSYYQYFENNISLLNVSLRTDLEQFDGMGATEQMLVVKFPRMQNRTAKNLMKLLYSIPNGSELINGVESGWVEFEDENQNKKWLRSNPLADVDKSFQGFSIFQYEEYTYFIVAEGWHGMGC